MNLACRVQRPLPARIGEEMQRHVTHPGHAVANPALLVLVFRSLERPVVEQGAAHDILPGHKTPVTAVRTFIPVVTHHEKRCRRHSNRTEIIAGLHDAGVGDAVTINAVRVGIFFTVEKYFFVFNLYQRLALKSSLFITDFIISKASRAATCFNLNANQVLGRLTISFNNSSFFGRGLDQK